jgi:hypothetical protein
MKRKLFVVTVIALLGVFLSVGGATGQGPIDPTPMVEEPFDDFVIAHGLLYWAEYCRVPGEDSFPGYLRHLPTRGGVTRTLSTTTQWDCDNFMHMVADETGIYYYHKYAGQIEFRPVDDPYDPPTVLATLTTGQAPVASLDLDEDYVYWVAENERVLRLPKTGGTPLTLVYTASNPRDIELAPAYGMMDIPEASILWLDDAGLWYIPQDCSAWPCADKTRLTSITGYDLHFRGDSFRPLFWVEESSPERIRVRVCGFTGCTTTTAYVAPTDHDWYISNVALGPCPDSDLCLYWRELYSDTCTGRLRRMPLYGGEVDDIAVNLCGWYNTVRTDDMGVYFQVNSTQLGRLPFDVSAIVRDLAADKWEVTQGIQNTSNDVALASNKTTYVRLYGRNDAGPPAYPVEAYLYGTRDGEDLPGSPLKSVGWNQRLEVGVGYDRGKRSAGWLFKLPDSWTEPGTIALTATVDPQGTLADSNLGNNSLSGDFTFQWETFPKPPVCTIFIPVRTHAPAKASVKLPNFWRMVDLFERLWPAPEVRVYTQSEPIEELEDCWWGPFPYPCWGPYELPGDKNWIMAKVLNRLWFSDDPDECERGFDESIYYVGMIHPDTPTGGLAGYGNLYYHASFLKLPESWANPPSDWTWPWAGSSLAHELGHNHGLGHVNCGDPGDTNYYPYPYCQLDWTGPENHYGFDINQLNPIPPEFASDFMSYYPMPQDQATTWRGRWVSDYNYERIFGVQGSLADPSSSTAATQAVDLSAAASVVFVSGSVDPGVGDSALDYAWVYPTGALSHRMLQKWQMLASPDWSEDQIHAESVSYHLRLLDPAGGVLADHTIEPLVSLESLGSNSLESVEYNAQTDETEPFTFVATFPAPEGEVARLELMADEDVLASLEPGSSTPSISVLQPSGGETFDTDLTISWQASDPDEDDHLLYNVQYSPNGGARWVSIVTGFPGPPDSDIASISLDDLLDTPGSDGQNGLIRVAASDGYNTAITESLPFEITDQPPQPYIVSPETSRTYAAGEFIPLRGGASDPEDGGLSGQSLRWSLDSNAVGTGREQMAAGLAPGSHQVSLTAQDSSGTTASESAALNIARLAIPSTSHAPTLNGVCDDVAYGEATLRLEPYASGDQATVDLVRTADHLWVCFSGMRRTSYRDEAGIGVDVDNSQDALAQANDYAFYVGEDGVPFTRSGSGGGGFGGEGPGGLLAQVSAGDTIWNAELRIDADVLDGWNHLTGVELGHSYRYWFTRYDFNWPYAAEYDAPETWAETTLGTVPGISALDPSSAPVGGGAFELTVVGENFTNGDVVLWGGQVRTTTFVSSTRLVAVIRGSDLGTAGEFPIQVRSGATAAFVSNALYVTVENPVPHISGLSPSSAVPGSDSFTLTVDGSDFANGAQILWNGAHKATTFVAPNRLQAAISADDVRYGREVGVTAVNPHPSGGASNTKIFYVGRAGSQRIYLPIIMK